MTEKEFDKLTASLSERRSPSGLDWLKFGALILAGVFAGCRFWYQEDYVPKHEPPTVDLRVEVTKLSPRGALLPIQVKVIAHNKNHYFRATVVHSWYTVCGRHFEPVVATSKGGLLTRICGGILAEVGVQVHGRARVR